MKTAFQVYIEQLEKIVDMGNRYHDKLKTMGIITQPAVEVFSKIYEK